MSQAEKLLQEVKSDMELKEVNGGCSAKEMYWDFMNGATGGCHSHRFCGSNGSSGSSGSGGHLCA